MYKELEDRIKAVANTTVIKQVIYDRLDAINTDSRNNYPLLLYRVDKVSSTDYKKPNSYSNLVVDFYLSDLFYQGDNLSLTEKQDYLDTLIDSVLKNIDDTDFLVLNTANGEFAWEQHNDNLFVVKKTITIRAFKCS